MDFVGVFRWLSACDHAAARLIENRGRWPRSSDVPDAMSARVGQQGQRPMADAPLLTEPLMTADEAAKLLHVPRSTLYELVRSRGLPHVRIGERGLRFTRSDLGSWIAENTYGPRRRR
jgi:excisionase family DNA binding protein